MAAGTLVSVPLLHHGSQGSAADPARAAARRHGGRGLRRALPAVPGSLYPVGFRAQVLGHAGYPPDAIQHELPAVTDDERLARVRSLLEGDASKPATLVSLAALLNVLSLYPVTVRCLAPRTSEPTLFYEVARAAYGLERNADQAIRPFRMLAERDDVPQTVKRSSLCRLIAHYCRRDRDLEACRPWADIASPIVEREQSEEFAVKLGVSRLCRALALYALRRRSPEEVGEMLRTAHTIAGELAARANGTAEYLTAIENERLVLEAVLKAFVGSKGRTTVLEPQTAVNRIRELAPCDPYSQLIAGDALWLLGNDGQALTCFQMAGAMGTYPGALAAYRAGTVLRALGRDAEAARWFAELSEFDAAYIADDN